MRNKTIITKNIHRRELIVERIVALPRRIAWEGWTRPEHLERWWGPRGWSATVHEMDVRVGGIWRYSMAPDDGSGDTARCIATYSEVVPGARLVYTDSFADRSWNVVEGSGMFTTVTFDTTSAGTRLRIITHFDNPEQLASAEAMGMVEGYQDAIERLETYWSAS